MFLFCRCIDLVTPREIYFIDNEKIYLQDRIIQNIVDFIVKKTSLTQAVTGKLAGGIDFILAVIFVNNP